MRGVGAVLGQTGAEAAPGTEPAVRCDFQSTHSVGSLRKTIGFAGGWGGGFNTAQLNLSTRGISGCIGPCTFIRC